MRIKFTTHLQGFRGTAKGDDPNVDKLFNPLSPSVAAEYRNKKSAIQNIIADTGTAVPATFGSNGKNFLSVGGWYATTAAFALAALNKLSSCELLREDKTIEIGEYKKSPEYTRVLKEAYDSGCRVFRPPVAKLHVSIAITNYEEDFVYGTYPKNILSNIEIVREPPLEVVPLHQVAANLSAYVSSLLRQIQNTGKPGMARDWLREAITNMSKVRSIVTEGLTTTTPESSEWKTKLIEAIDKMSHTLDTQTRTISRWDMRRWATSFQNEPDSNLLKLSGLAVFDERPEPEDAEINVNHVSVDDELSIDDI